MVVIVSVALVAQWSAYRAGSSIPGPGPAPAPGAIEPGPATLALSEPESAEQTAPRPLAPEIGYRPSQGSVPESNPAPTGPAPSVFYASCADARLAGVAPIPRGAPGYRDALDRDQDGTACDVSETAPAPTAVQPAPSTTPEVTPSPAPSTETTTQDPPNSLTPGPPPPSPSYGAPATP